MFKILIIAVVIIVLGTIFAAVSFLSPKDNASKDSTSTIEGQLLDGKAEESTESGTLLDQIKEIAKESDAKPGAGSASISTEDHINLLEQTVIVLQKRIDALEKSVGIKVSSSPAPAPASTTSTETTAKVPAYIPLGAVGTTNDTNYITLKMFEATINPADYPGYSSMQLEVNFKSNQNGGPTYVRLFNSSDNSAVSGSETSYTSDAYTWITSGKFTIASGTKTYNLQAKNAANVETTIQSARIRVNF